MEKIKIKKTTKKTTSAESLNDLIISLIQDKKGKNLISLDLRKIPEAMSDYFIICHGDSTTQVRAITDYLEEEVRKQTGAKPYHLEGRNNAEWCLIDFGNVIVHVFEKEKRDFYQLEDLWSDGILQRFED